MLNEQRFREQMNFLSTLFMRELPVELLNEYWREFHQREQQIWDKTIEQATREETRFPMISVLRQYYEMNMPGRPDPEFPTDEDLEKAAKTGKHKYYLGLIRGLYEGRIQIDDPRVLRCLKKQGSNPAFKRFDPKRRIFEKT